MRLVFAILLAAASSHACSCLNTGTPCSYVGSAHAIFVGRVLIDSGEGWGNRTARVVIEEALQNVDPKLREIDVETSAGTSCYHRLKEGERYAIFAQRPESKDQSFSIGACSKTFNVRGNEHILDALRNQSKGGPPRLVGTVLRNAGRYSQDSGVPGASVVLEADGTRQEAVTDGFGHYEFRGLAPNRYNVEVSKNGFVADSEYNRRWSGRLALNQSTNTFEPDKTGPGTVLISKNSCQVWDLALWPNGRILGTVRGTDRQPLSGVSVQAFSLDPRGERESSPLRSAASGPDGTYTLDRLPAGDYVIGVNAETYRDAEAYPPTIYSTEARSTIPTPVHIGESQTVNGIDLAVPPKRMPTRLRVKVVSPNGVPCVGALVKLDNDAGVQRWYSRENTGTSGWTEVPVYLGEHYIVRATDYTVERDEDFDYLEGSAPFHVTEENQFVTIVLARQQFPK